MHRLSFPLIVSLCLLALPRPAAAEPFKIPPNEAASAHMEKGSDPADFVRKCPPGFNDTPAMPAHYGQSTILGMPLEKVFALGQQTFVTNFNACDGAGRPATTGTGAARTPDPVMGPRFTRVSAPETSSCAGCHSATAAGRGRRFRRQCIRAGAGSRSGFAHHPQRGFQQHLGRTQYARNVRRRRNRDARASDDGRPAGRATGRHY